jgi:UDP-N-acetylmuramate dehydrogenase
MTNLSELTTLHVGGPAKKLVRATSEAELIAAVKDCDEIDEPVLIVGGGSNILVSDDGFVGTVIVVETQGNSYEIDACSGGLLQVSAGVDWDEFVEFAIGHGLANLESLSGIPGTVGAAAIGNIGAYGHEVSEVIARVRTFDRQTQQIKTFTADQCSFSYRSSLFKEEVNRYVILDVMFHLRRSENSLPIAYQELADVLGVPLGSRAPVVELRKVVLEIRSKKGMLYSKEHLINHKNNFWSAGSFFMNPILAIDQIDRLPPDAPRWPQADGLIKTSAAWLMEHAGVKKGDVLNGAKISDLHVLALTNAGDATATDIVLLARSARTKVMEKYGITLEPEVTLVGLEL